MCRSFGLILSKSVKNVSKMNIFLNFNRRAILQDCKLYTFYLKQIVNANIFTLCKRSLVSIVAVFLCGNF